VCSEVDFGSQVPESSPFISGKVILGLTGGLQDAVSCWTLSVTSSGRDLTHLLHTVEEKAISSVLEEAAEEVQQGRES
jgi:hypothetical protein